MADKETPEAAPAEEKLVPVKKPDETNFNESKDKCNKTMETMKRQLRSVQEEIQTKRNASQELQKKIAAERKKLQPLRNQRNALRSERKKLYDAKDAANDRIQAKKQIAQKMKDDLRFTNLNQINDEIKKLEYRQKTTSFPTLIAEKAAIREIEKLRSQRKAVERYSQAMGASKADELANKELRVKIREASQKLGDAEKKLDKMSKFSRELQQKLNEGKDLRPLFKKQNEIRDAMTATRKELDVLYSKHKEDMKEYNAYMSKVREKKYAAQKEERAAYRAEMDAKQKEMEEEKAKEKPWMKEIGSCDSMISYLTSLLPKDYEPERRLDDGNAFTREEFVEFYGGLEEWKTAPPAAKGAEKNNDGVDGGEITLPDGTKVKAFGKKKGKDMIEIGGGGHKHKRNRRKKKKKFAVRHTPETLYTFSFLKLKPPMSIDDVEQSLDDLHAKRDYFDKLPRAVPKAKGKPKAAAKADKAPAAKADEAPETKKWVPKLLEAKPGEFNEYITYDEDAALGADAPALDGLEAVQCGPVPKYADKKTTVVYFWAKFLKWQCYPSLIAMHELAKAKPEISIVAVSVDPKKDAIESHIKKAKLYNTDMGDKKDPVNKPQGGKTDLCLCYDAGAKVKNAFRKVTKMDAFMAPSAFIVVDGTIVWRSAFSSAYPYTTSRFAEQLEACMGGKPLYKFGANPKPPPSDDDEELDGYGEDEEADDVFAAAAKDGDDGAW